MSGTTFTVPLHAQAQKPQNKILNSDALAQLQAEQALEQFWNGNKQFFAGMGNYTFNAPNSKIANEFTEANMAELSEEIQEQLTAIMHKLALLSGDAAESYFESAVSDLMRNTNPQIVKLYLPKFMKLAGEQSSSILEATTGTQNQTPGVQHNAGQGFSAVA